MAWAFLIASWRASIFWRSSADLSDASVERSCTSRLFSSGLSTRARTCPFGPNRPP